MTTGEHINAVVAIAHDGTILYCLDDDRGLFRNKKHFSELAVGMPAQQMLRMIAPTADEPLSSTVELDLTVQDKKEHFHLRGLNSGDEILVAISTSEGTVDELLTKYANVVFSIKGKSAERAHEITDTDKPTDIMILLDEMSGLNNELINAKRSLLKSNVRLGEQKVMLDKSVEEKESLLRELQHRVKNSMTLISGMVSLERSRAAEQSSKDILTNILDRIIALGHLYDLLYMSDSVDEIRLDRYLARLIGLHQGSYGSSRNHVRLVSQLDEMTVNIKSAIPIGLIVNELLTNAYKYSFPGDREGVITVLLKKQEHLILLEVSDNGIGIREGESGIGAHDGIGQKLIVLMAKQLEGKMETISENGLTFRFHIPAE